MAVSFRRDLEWRHRNPSTVRMHLDASVDLLVSSVQAVAAMQHVIAVKALVKTEGR